MIVRDIARDGATVTGLQLELKLDGDFRKMEKKVTWLAEQGSSLVDAELWEFDYLLTKDTFEQRRKTGRLPCDQHGHHD